MAAPPWLSRGDFQELGLLEETDLEELQEESDYRQIALRSGKHCRALKRWQQVVGAAGFAAACFLLTLSNKPLRHGFGKLPLVGQLLDDYAFPVLPPDADFVQGYIQWVGNGGGDTRDGYVGSAGICLDVKEGQAVKGTRLQGWTCDYRNANQQFILPKKKGVIRWALQPERCLEAVPHGTGGDGVDGAYFDLWECDENKTTMQFIMPEDGQGPIRWAKDPTKCMAIVHELREEHLTQASVLDGAPVELEDCGPKTHAEPGYDGQLVHPNRLFLIPSLYPAYVVAKAPQGLTGQYGYLTEFWVSDLETRRRVDQMRHSFGITEFQFYLVFEKFSHPPGDVESWTCSVEDRQILKKSLRHAVNYTNSFGRSWLQLPAQASDPADEHLRGGIPVIDQHLVDKKVAHLFFEAFDGQKASMSTKTLSYADACGCQMSASMLSEGKDSPPTLMSMVPLNVAWAIRIVPQWAKWAQSMGFKGIHWDTEGDLGGDATHKHSDIKGFLRAAIPYLQRHDLVQTLNFVDGYGWDATLLTGFKAVAFPYWEVWQHDRESAFHDSVEGKNLGDGFVLACYPGWTQFHCCLHNEQQNAAEYGVWPLDLGIKRWQQAHSNGGSYLFIGDGLRHAQGPFLPDSVSIAEMDVAKIQAMVSVRPPR